MSNSVTKDAMLWVMGVIVTIIVLTILVVTPVSCVKTHNEQLSDKSRIEVIEASHLNKNIRIAIIKDKKTEKQYLVVEGHSVIELKD